MEYCYSEYNDKVYQEGFLAEHGKSITDWCEKNDISLNNKAKEKLLDTAFWLSSRKLLDAAQTLMQVVGEAEFTDFNLFKDKVDAALKASSLKLSAP